MMVLRLVFQLSQTVLKHLNLLVIRLEEDRVLEEGAHVHRGLVINVVAAVRARGITVVTAGVRHVVFLLVVAIAVEVLLVVLVRVKRALVMRIVVNVVALGNIVEDACLVGVDRVLIIAVIEVAIVAIVIIIAIVVVIVV